MDCRLIQRARVLDGTRENLLFRRFLFCDLGDATATLVDLGDVGKVGQICRKERFYEIYSEIALLKRSVGARDGRRRGVRKEKESEKRSERKASYAAKARNRRQADFESSP